MAYSYEDIMRSDFQRIADEQALAAAELEAGRISEDAYRVQAATKQILQLDLERNALAVRANNFVAGQQAQPQGNKYGLSQDEIDIARGQFGGDRSISNDEREKIYAENKQKLRHLRQTGQYRDDQGTVRR